MDVKEDNEGDAEDENVKRVHEKLLSSTQLMFRRPVRKQIRQSFSDSA